MMQAYGIDYTVKGKPFSAVVDAKDAKSAKTKLGRKHGYKDGRMIKVTSLRVVGYL
jgi:hypothetical protein